MIWSKLLCINVCMIVYLCVSGQRETRSRLGNDNRGGCWWFNASGLGHFHKIQWLGGLEFELLDNILLIVRSSQLVLLYWVLRGVGSMVGSVG
jgi:hypothetical protein